MDLPDVNPEGYKEGSVLNHVHKFPDKVIGEWTCWGYHVGDGFHTESGPVVVTTQMFTFGSPEDTDYQTITSIGYERMDIPTPFLRAVTGGTGRYYAASGEQHQTFLGFNSLEGVSLKVSFDLVR